MKIQKKNWGGEGVGGVEGGGQGGCVRRIEAFVKIKKKKIGGGRSGGGVGGSVGGVRLGGGGQGGCEEELKFL